VEAHKFLTEKSKGKNRFMTKRIASLMILLFTAFTAFGANNTRVIGVQNQFHLPVKGHSSQHALPQAQGRRAQALAAKAQPAVQSSRVKHFAANPPVSQIGFVSATEIPAGGAIAGNSSALAGDFNGDGKKDVVTMVNNSGSFSISVVLSNGNGTFQAAVLTAVPSNEFDAFAVGDLNGDGKDDVVVIHLANGSSPSNFDVMLSNGDGTFTQGSNNVITANALVGGLLYDMNGDGKMDMVAVDSSNPGNVLTMLGNGDGTFQSPTSIALAGAAGSSLVFADFNGDGLLDFAGNDPNTNALTVYLATSATQFATGVPYTTSDNATDSCSSGVGDMTGDGKPEIINVNCNDGTVTVFVNNGDGTFQTGVYYASAIAPSTQSIPYIVPAAVTVADVNGDGNGDLVVSNYFSGDVTVLLGNGDGTVQVPVIGYATAGYPNSAAIVADFNGDKLPDILLTDNMYSFSYMKGYGDGTFSAGVDYYSPTTDNGNPYAWDVATGDFNGDGFPDVVIGNWCCDAAVGITVYLSRGDGSLQPGINYGTDGYFAFVAVADFNKDGKLDIAAMDNSTGLVQIFNGVGDGTFTTGPTMVTGDTDSRTIVAVDLNGDGYPDVAVANNGGSNVGVILNDGTGALLAPVNYALSKPATDIALADLNADGKLDLIALQQCGCVAVMLGNGDGTFGAESDVSVGNSPFQLAVGDLNGDGKLDLAITIWDTTQGLQVVLGNGDGTFQTASAVYPTSLQGTTYNPYPAYIKLLDLDGDGHLDAIYTNSNYGTVGIMYGVGDGTFYDPVEYPAGGYSVGLALADVNGDGAVDAVTTGDDTSQVSVLLNNSGSKLVPDYALAATPSSATVTAGTNGTFVITLSPRNFYNGTVTFACGTLPSKTTCVFSNPTLVPNGNGLLTTTLTVQTTAATTTTTGMLIPNSSRAATRLVASLTGLGLLGLMLSGDWRKKAGRGMGMLLAVVALGMTCTLVACGGSPTSSNNNNGGGGGNGGGTTTTTVPGTPTGSYTVVVTGTGTAGTNHGNAAAHNLNLTLTVQ
jgi:hypothetical protein